MTHGVAKRDLKPGDILTRDDVYFSVPLLKGQISTREFQGGERVNAAMRAHGAIVVDAVDAPIHANRDLVALIRDRGLTDVGPASKAVGT